MTENEWYQEYKHLEALIDKQKAEIERLKALLAHAADALEQADWRVGDYIALITELRKAAAE